ncbi:MAG TPA: porin family protein [Mucilaginibacter sp.]|jgi:hypothetical protein
MKKILLLAGLIIGSINAFSQSATFGIKGGVNFGQLYSTFENTTGAASTGLLTTYSIGVFADVKISDKVSIQPGFSYAGKGGNEKNGDSVIKAKLFYLQFPVNAVYHVEIDPGEIYFGVGPYLGYGLSANVQVNDGKSTQNRNVGFGGGETKYQSLDAGFNGLVGIKFDNGLLVDVHYDFGLTNVSNISGINTTNRVFGVSVGYAFK